MRAYGVIPARLASSRLPGKLLLDETGKPLIQYAWEAARGAKSLKDVIVAADGVEIAAAVRGFGGRCELTGAHPSGTDRIAEVARKSLPDADVVVNIQGDEPEIDPAQIDRLVESFYWRPDVPMATLATPIASRAELEDPSCVKVVCAEDGRALYFSRSAIPHLRDGDPDEIFANSLSRKPTHCNGWASSAPSNPATSSHSPLPKIPWLLHMGVYAYRRDFLLKLTTLQPSWLERLEKLEQLRALEAGASIHVEVVDHRAVGIDTPEDYAGFVERQKHAQKEAA